MRPAQIKPPDTECPLKLQKYAKRWLLIIRGSYRSNDEYTLFIIISDQFIAYLQLFINQNLYDGLYYCVF